MRIENKDLCSSFAVPGSCEYCLRVCRMCHGHHIYPTGAGGGSRLDIRLNLVRLGDPFCCGCHRGFHDRNDPSKEDFLGIVRRREHCQDADVEAVLNSLAGLPKNPRPREVSEIIRRFSLGDGEQRVLFRTLAEAGVELEDAA